MVAIDAGIETVTYALADAPEEFEETFDALKNTDKACEIAVNSPAECLMIPENLSSESVGKKFFKRCVQPYEAYWTERIRDAGKYSYIHIDGTLRGLIRECSQTGFNVLEAVTPGPVGDIEPEELQNWVEPGTIIWGGIPGLYFSDLISDDEFDAYVIRVLDVWKSEPRYVLGVADQVPPLSGRNASRASRRWSRNTDATPEARNCRSMPFQPDYRHMLDVLANRRPARLPIYEHIISPTIMEQILGVRFAALEAGRRRPIWTSSSATTAASGRR